MPDEVATFGRAEKMQRCGDERAHVIEGARACRSEEGLQFGEGEFDRIEVGAVRREKPELGADGVDGGADLRLFMDRGLSSTTTSPGRNVGTRTCST